MSKSGLETTSGARAARRDINPLAVKVSDAPQSLPTIRAWGIDDSPFYYRCVVPFRGLHRNHLAVAHVPAIRSLDGVVRPSDVFVLQRCKSQAVANRMQNLKRLGLVVADSDDDELHMLASEFYPPLPAPPGSDYLPRDGETVYEHGLRAYEYQLRQLWPLRCLMSADTLQREIRRHMEHEWPATDQDVIPGSSEFRATVFEQTAKVGGLVHTAHSLDQAIQAARALAPLSIAADILRTSDLVTVSTEPLAAQYSALSDHVRVLPNPIDLQDSCYQPKERRRRHAGIILGHAGTWTHQEDLKVVAPALSAILHRFDGIGSGPRVRLMIGGDPRAFSGPLGSLPGARQFAREIAGHYGDSNLPQNGLALADMETLESRCGRYLYRPFMLDVAASPVMYADVDIGLVPLQVDTAFNRCKSDLKGLEMAGMGVPCIASPIDAYKRWRSIENGCVVLEQNTPYEWRQALVRLIQDKALRRRMAEAALDFAKTRSIDVWAPKWMEAYTEAARRKGLAWAS